MTRPAPSIVEDDIRLLRGLISVLFLLLTTASAAESLSGIAIYRARITMPPEANIRAILNDISSNDQVEIWRRAQADAQIHNAPLLGTHWRLEELDGVPLPEGLPEPQVNLVLRLDDGTFFRATVSCNSTEGVYELDGDAFSFLDVATTELPCLSPGALLERQFGAMLLKVASYSVEGNMLRFFDANGSRVSVFSAIGP